MVINLCINKYKTVLLKYCRKAKLAIYRFLQARRVFDKHRSAGVIRYCMLLEGIRVGTRICASGVRLPFPPRAE